MSSPPNLFLDPKAGFAIDGSGAIIRSRIEDQLPQSGPVVASRYSNLPPKPAKKPAIPTAPVSVPDSTPEELATHKPRYPPMQYTHAKSPALLALLRGYAGEPAVQMVEAPHGNVPTAPPGAAWYSPDVHSWTTEMRNLIKEEFPRLRDQTRIYASEFDTSVAEICQRFKDDILVKQTLDKMVARRNAIDTDLFGVVPAGLLALVWIEYVKKIDEPECYTLFQETLHDMGTTCLQGDSFRLLSILVALERD